MSMIDVTEATFPVEVIDRSRTVPVVVDFWASWCGPCRALGPLLEAAADRREGDVVLAKVDTDANPGLAQAFGIRGIPAVKAFRDGEVVDEFVGAQPAPAVERFFDGLVPSQIDALVADGDEQSLRAALETEPGRADAAIPLARLLAERGERQDALEVLGNVAGSFQADGLAARLRLADALEQQPELNDSVGPALAALEGGELERALDLLIEALPGANGHRDDVRQVIVGELDALGADHPVARDARRRLAAALY
jgi:putative thioredoxin